VNGWNQIYEMPTIPIRPALKRPQTKPDGTLYSTLIPETDLLPYHHPMRTPISQEFLDRNRYYADQTGLTDLLGIPALPADYGMFTLGMVVW